MVVFSISNSFVHFLKSGKLSIYDTLFRFSEQISSNISSPFFTKLELKKIIIQKGLRISIVNRILVAVKISTELGERVKQKLLHF